MIQSTPLVPFDEFTPLLSQLRQALSCSNDEALRLVGYSRNGSGRERRLS